MQTRTYLGPYPAVEITSPDGRSFGRVRRGQSIEVPDVVAAALDAQGDRWQRPADPQPEPDVAPDTKAERKPVVTTSTTKARSDAGKE